MRVWDVPVEMLCDKHLLGQHLEIHTMHSVIVNNKRGYANHPETVRWRNNTEELRLVHDQTVQEMLRRGMKHKSPIDGPRALKRSSYGLVDPINRQIHEIYRKGCQCNLDYMQHWYDLTGQFLDISE